MDDFFEQILSRQSTIINTLKDMKGEKQMKILSHLIEKANDTMDEIEFYSEQAHHLKVEHKSLADAYIKVAEMHITIYGILHDQMVALIDKYKKEGNEPPKEMTVIWAYEHEKLVKEFEHMKYLVEDYKKSY